MPDYSKLLADIQELRNRKNTIAYVEREKYPNFPMEQMYEGQYGALKEIDSLKSLVLSPHTGAGKTAVFIGATRGQPTIVIEPRKFLQKQVTAYYERIKLPYSILFGRSEYPCNYAVNAGQAPCQRKVRCTTTYHKNECEQYTMACEKKPCRVFLTESGFRQYPCQNCAYFTAQAYAMSILRGGGTVVCNFGNFWTLLKDCDNIVIDEADLFFREISTPKILYTAKSDDEEIKVMLQRELAEIDRRMQTTTTQQYYALKNAEYGIKFLLDNAELCFAYKKKDYKTKTEKVYVEINPDSVNILKDKIFAGKRLIVVTATPTNFNLPNVTYTIPQRCGIFYAPQGKLTARELQQQPWLLDNAIKEFIIPVSEIFTAAYGSEQFIIHCGNLGHHAERANTLLGPEKCTLHTRGKLMDTIDAFKHDKKRYLLVASAEYGLDASFCDCQFILKVPYASLDDRMKALEKKLGKQRFKRWYSVDAINRLVQQAGRIGRGFDSFGCTFVLDSKFKDLYRMYKDVFPEWFLLRFIGDI